MGKPRPGERFLPSVSRRHCLPIRALGRRVGNNGTRCPAARQSSLSVQSLRHAEPAARPPSGEDQWPPVSGNWKQIAGRAPDRHPAVALPRLRCQAGKACGGQVVSPGRAWAPPAWRPFPLVRFHVPMLMYQRLLPVAQGSAWRQGPTGRGRGAVSLVIDPRCALAWVLGPYLRFGMRHGGCLVLHCRDSAGLSPERRQGAGVLEGTKGCLPRGGRGPGCSKGTNSEQLWSSSRCTAQSARSSSTTSRAP